MNRRSRWVALVAALSILCISAGFVYLRGGSTRVPVGSAVERFRARSEAVIDRDADKAARSDVDTSGAEAPQVRVPASVEVAPERTGRPRPAEGVYVYATTGGDDVDVLGGSRHTYPPQTTITVSHAGCGLVERWDALEERWDERESCRTAGGDTLKRMTSFHEFFGHADQRTLRCTGFTSPAGIQPGASWSSRCASDNTTATSKLTAVGWEDVEVAGAPVRTMHVHVETKLSGEQVGTSVRDVWGSADTGLVIREHTKLESFSNQPVFGRTRYHEEYEIRATSLEPRR